MESLHARVEVDQPDRHAGDADDRQAGLLAFGADEPALRASMSSGSAKMSMVSKPISLVMRMP